LEEYKANSNRARDGELGPIQNKKLGSVVTGHAETQKKVGLGKYTGSIISSDLKSVGDFLMTDVLIPSVKKALADIVVNGIDMLLYGKSGMTKSNSSVSKVSYSNYYNRPYNEPVRAGSNGNSLDYDNIIFDNRGDAEAVLTSMEDILDQFGCVGVADLYDLADVAAPNYTVNNYGWTNLANAQVLRCRDGYIIKLPKVTSLK
jgi:hypothetical protein